MNDRMSILIAHIVEPDLEARTCRPRSFDDGKNFHHSYWAKFPNDLQ